MQSSRLQTPVEDGLLGLVAGGIGLAPLPQSALEARQCNRICFRSLTDPEVVRPIGLLRRLGQTDTAAVTAMVSAIRTAASQSKK